MPTCSDGASIICQKIGDAFIVINFSGRCYRRAQPGRLVRAFGYGASPDDAQHGVVCGRLKPCVPLVASSSRLIPIPWINENMGYHV
jgi:hypothetical protein